MNKLFVARHGTAPVQDTAPPLSPEQKARGVDVPVDIHDLRRSAGVTLDLPKNIEAQWESWAEADVLSWATRQGLPSSTIQQMLDWYADRSIPGYNFGPEDEAEFCEVAPKFGLSKQQADTLIRWHRTYMGDEGGGNAAPASNHRESRQAPSTARTERTDQPADADAADAVIKQLRREWGGAFDQKFADAQRAVDDVGGDEIAELLDETGLGNDPRVIRMFARIGRLTR